MSSIQDLLTRHRIIVADDFATFSLNGKDQFASSNT
jgi:hypothetical protein